MTIQMHGGTTTNFNDEEPVGGTHWGGWDDNDDLDSDEGDFYGGGY